MRDRPLHVGSREQAPLVARFQGNRVRADALEDLARDARRSLLTLDTVTGGAAEPLFLSLGYVAFGAIPSYALNFNASGLESTTVMYKRLPDLRTFR